MGNSRQVNMQLSGSETRELFYQTKKENIYYLRIYLEAYEGLAIMTTLDKASTELRFTYLACSDKEVKNLLNSFEQDKLIWKSDNE